MSNDARIPELVNGRVDILTADLGYTPQRAQQIDYSLQYYVSPHRLDVRTDKGLNSLADMAGKKVSFIKGSTTEGFVRASVPTASLVNFDDAQPRSSPLSKEKSTPSARPISWVRASSPSPRQRCH
jgi:polar amino acid transport system substrate-binding protein